MNGGGAPPFMPMPAAPAGAAPAQAQGLWGGVPQTGGFQTNPLFMAGVMGLANAASGQPSGPGMARGYALGQQAQDNAWSRQMQGLQMAKLMRDEAKNQQTEKALAGLVDDPAFAKALGDRANVWSALPMEQQASVAMDILNKDLRDGTVVKAADGYNYWATGPKAGERVLPDVEKLTEQSWTTMPKSNVRYDKTTGEIHPDDQARYASLLAEGDEEALGFEDTQKLRKEYDKLKPVKDARAIKTSLERLENLIQAEAGFADHSTIFTYMKILDPDSVVREGEFYYASQVGSMQDRVANLMNKMVAGETLTDDQREELLYTVRALAKPSLQQGRAAQERYTEYARRYGVDPFEVVGAADAFPDFELGEPPRRSRTDVPSGPAPASEQANWPEWALGATAARLLQESGIDPTEPDARKRLIEWMERRDAAGQQPLAPGMGGPGGVWAGRP